MEQVEGGDLVVNKGNESRLKESDSTDPGREMNAVEGYDAALKLALVCLALCNLTNDLMLPSRPI